MWRYIVFLSQRYGVPQLMMAFTDDGQADANNIAARDRRLGVSSARKRESRRDIPMPAVDSSANSWQSDRSQQTTLEDRQFKR